MQSSPTFVHTNRVMAVAFQDNNGWTPMHIAAGNGHLEVVRLLLDQGADLAVQNNDG